MQSNPHLPSPSVTGQGQPGGTHAHPCQAAGERPGSPSENALRRLASWTAGNAHIDAEDAVTRER
jgi:hypothetical protein